MKIASLLAAILPASFTKVSESLSPEVMTDLSTDVQNLNAQLEAARADLSTAQTSIADLQAQLAQREEELATAQTSLADVQSQLTSSTEQVTSLEAMIDGFKAGASKLPKKDVVTQEQTKEDPILATAMGAFSHLPKN